MEPAVIFHPCKRNLYIWFIFGKNRHRFEDADGDPNK